MEYYIISVAFHGVNENKGEDGVITFKTLANNMDEARNQAYSKLDELNQEDCGEYVNLLKGIESLEDIKNL